MSLRETTKAAATRIDWPHSGWLAKTVILPRSALISSALASCIALFFYAATMGKDITWSHFGADGGELITASMTLGIPHPPGYPLYTLLGRVFGSLPLGSVAARYNFFSAAAASVVVGVVVYTLTIRNRCQFGGDAIRCTLAPMALGLAFALTPLVWSQASIAEVYTPSLMFLALFIWAVVTGRSPFLVGLTLGLSITGHLTAVLLLPLALWRTRRSGLARMLAGALLGLTPFLLLPLLASGSSPVVWGNARTVQGWWWIVSARLYEPNVFALPLASWPDRLYQWFGSEILIPLLTWLLLALVGVWQTRKERNSLVAPLLATAALYWVYAFTYRTGDAAVLLLPGLLLTAVAAGLWLARVDRAVVWLLPTAMLLLAVISRDPRDDGAVRGAARQMLAHVPPGAIVLTPGDASISALWYFHHVEGLRQDVIIVDENMFQFDWYRHRLKDASPDLIVPADDNLPAFVSANLAVRPICQLTLRDLDSLNCNLPAEEEENGERFY